MLKDISKINIKQENDYQIEFNHTKNEMDIGYRKGQDLSYDINMGYRTAFTGIGEFNNK